ncbi:MAG: A24 family peptidase [Pirellulaceae bacterium]
MHVGPELVAAVALFTATAAVIDYRTRKIPNWLNVAACLLGLAYNGFAPGGIGLGLALLGLAIGFALLLLPWMLGGGGAGDVKLLAALGAWLGPLMILVAFGTAAVLAALGTVLILTGSAVTHQFSPPRRRYVGSGAAGGASLSDRAAAGKARRVLPFAVPVALATWLVLGWLMLKSQGL